MARIEIFSAGCPTCYSAELMVRELACPECELEIVPVTSPAGHARAAASGVARVPAVAVNGRLVACCRGETPSWTALQQAIAA